MLNRPTPQTLPRQRMSPPALATSAVIHIALLWLLIQYSPIESAIRYVVYQYVQPISPSATNSRAIGQQPVGFLQDARIQRASQDHNPVARYRSGQDARARPPGA